MIMKTLAKTNEWKKLIREIKEARKDPEFMKGIKEFIEFHEGRLSS